jgi:hypothetical protein
MDKVLKIIGLIWSLIGTTSIFLGMYRVPSPEGEPTAGLVFNVGLFIIPGLLAYAIGAGISRKRVAESQSKGESH